MTITVEPQVQWTPSMMIEVLLNEPDDFLKVRETLTRIGVASRKEKKLYQSCHILHKQGRYYIVHFKELFALDGKHANLTVNDVQRRNRIVRLLLDWGLLSVVNPDEVVDIAPLNQIKVLAYKDKEEWILDPDAQGFQAATGIGVCPIEYRDCDVLCPIDCVGSWSDPPCPTACGQPATTLDTK